MAAVITTNVSSLNTQRNLAASQSSLNVSIQRLSTGLRVNSAKDDAAGLAIAERMNAQIKGLSVAARNANDGVSLAQSAEGALGKVGEMVQRVRELAVQSSNATNNSEDRAALQAEVKQLKEEIDRVANTTKFNGTALLDGSFKNARFQVGADANQSITVDSIADANIAAMGAIKDYSGTGIVPTADSSFVAGDLKINGVDIGAFTGNATLATQTADLVTAINLKTSETGVTASAGAGNELVLTSSLEINVEATAAGAAASGFSTGKTTISTEVGTAAGSLSTLDISTYLGAQEAIRRTDSALKTINTARADLGAVQSRFENAIANIQISTENMSAARSRMMDTDFASETANLTRAQILQQAGNAMLSQANQIPQQVLSLLR